MARVVNTYRMTQGHVPLTATGRFLKISLNQA